MKRLGVFVFYDKNGIVDNYVTYLLSQMSKVLDRLVIVSNCHLQKDEKDKLLVFTSDYFERENTGRDGGAYQDVLCNLIGWNEVRLYDELTLFNDTYYGLFCTADHMFDKMTHHVCDFWGITIQFEIPEYSIPEHVQSYFLVIKSRLLHDLAFENWWQNFVSSNDLWTNIRGFECSFTEHFAKLGYKYSSFVDTNIWRGEKDGDPMNFQGDRQYRLLTECACPVLKKRNISTYTQDFSNDAMKSICYIAEHTNYDVNMIWDNLLRLYEMSIMHKSLHFNFSISDTLPSKEVTFNATIIFIVTDKYSISLLKYYIDNIKVHIIYIFAKTEEIYNLLYEYGLNGKANILQLDYSATPFLLVNKDSDYYFYLTDETLNDIDLRAIDKIRIHNFDSLIKSQYYLENLLLYMQQNERIGLIMPESLDPILGEKNIDWKKLYPDIKKFLKQLDLTAPISKEVIPFIHSKCFCAKRRAIMQLFNFENSTDQISYDILPYALLYIAQANGYLTGKTALPYETDCFAEQNISSLNALKSEIIQNQQQFTQQQDQIAILQKELHNVYSSWSWKLSKPMRIADSCARRIQEKLSKLIQKRQTAVSEENKNNETNSYENYVSEYEKQKNITFSHNIKFSIIVLLHNTDSKVLKEMLLSVISQSYQHWELCILDASDTSNEYVGLLCRNAAQDDSRILYKKTDQNEDISDNTNTAIAMATGDYIALIDHDDLITPDALFENAKAINEHEPEVLYSDEMLLSESGEFTHPFYKPDWSPDLLNSHDYMYHFLVVKKELVSKINGLRTNFNEAQDYNFILHLSKEASKIHHISKILYIGRQSQTSTSEKCCAPYANHNDSFFSKLFDLMPISQEKLDIKKTNPLFKDCFFKLLYSHWQTDDFLKTVELVSKQSKNKGEGTQYKCVDIGGPSDLFYPIYDITGQMDIVNFSMQNTWGTLSSDYHYKDRLMGKVIEQDATDLNDIQDETYDVVLSSNNLEHIANPLKAVKEWIRILKQEGMLIILVPAKEYTFDHKRKIVSFSHLLDDFKNDVKEDDLTHLDEILSLHDLSMDPPAGTFDQFQERSMKNFENRCLHQHVFDCDVLKQIANYFNMEILFANEQYFTNWMLVAKKRK